MTIPDAVRPRRPRRETLGIAAGLMALLVVVAIALYAMRAATDAQHRAQASQTADATAIAKLSTALDQTRKQLQQHGVTPSAPPATTIVKEIPGATGAAGQSITGPQGPAGKDGVSPDPAAVAALAAAMIHPSPGPSGPPGRDSTVPGPQGVPGPASTVAGPQGPQGVPGKDSTVPGPKGDQGTAGQPPAGWTFTDGQGDTQDCERAANFDPNSPRYTCTITSKPSPSPSSPSPSPAPSNSSPPATNASTNKSRTASATSTGPR